MTGFVRIAPEGYHTEASLKAWLNRALDFVYDSSGEEIVQSVSEAKK